MPPTNQSGKQQSSTAGTGFGSSSSSPKSSSKFSKLIQELRGKQITKTKLRNEIMNSLYDGATDNPEEGKWYFFEYDPKYRDILKKWDQFPVIQVVGFKHGNVLGANLHYMKQNARLKAINNNRFPASSLHYYIPKRADAIFFEIDELDVPTMSQMPVEKFHRNT